jgi:hypothetical protein
MRTEEKWQVIFVSAEERYGLATRSNNLLRLTCRGMTEPVARRLCRSLNAIKNERKFQIAHHD